MDVRKRLQIQSRTYHFQKESCFGALHLQFPNKMILKALIACVCAHLVAGQGSIPGVKDSCFLDPEPGICKAYLPSFYYNKAAKYCDCFVYTGCSGNENRYETLDECRFACNVASNQQIITNHCRNLLRGTKILADLLNRTEFQGIDNYKPPKTDVATTGQEADVDCSLPPEMGSCRAYLPSYFYDPQNKLCDCFVYSGCGGNVNRFRTLNDCRVSCDVGVDKQVITKSCKNILQQSTAQWAEYLEQLNGPPVQDSTIDKIDIRKLPPQRTDNSKNSTDKEPTSSTGTRNEPPVQSSNSVSDKDSSFRPSIPDKDSSFRPSIPGNVNSQSRPTPTGVSPQFIPGPVLPDVPRPIRPRPALPPMATVMYVFHRIHEIKGSDGSRGDRD